MNVTQVAIRPTEASEKAGRPALTPELLAASGARYSRNNQGLNAILDRIDPNNLDKSVDSIFRLIDYGHQSIADMAPVAMFMDGLSLWLAYYVWTLCPTAGGQESSTRYIRLRKEDLLAATELGIPAPVRAEWNDSVDGAFEAYAKALTAWEDLSRANPSVTGIPEDILRATDKRAQRKAGRMRRNYGFDRARYFLPAAAPTNVMLVMSARGWAALCQHLCSHVLPEALALGAAIREELGLAAPRLMKHATAKDSVRDGLAREFAMLSAAARTGCPNHLQPGTANHARAATAALAVLVPEGVDGPRLAGDLQHHDNRYAWFGTDLQRLAVRFSWEAMAMAEIRDLNRHRTGNKFCPLRPLGFYSAREQIPASDTTMQGCLLPLDEQGAGLSARAHELLAAGDATYVYWTLMGTQYAFEHTTTADKFLYEAELRTGTGAHFQYAAHMRDALTLWYERYPETRGGVNEGHAEPE